MQAHDITKFLGSIVQAFAEELKDYKKEIVVILAILIGGGLYFGGRYYLRSREQAAFATLAEYVEEYDKALNGKEEDWPNLEMLFKMGYDQHSSSYAAPYFLIFQVDALIQQNKNQEALTLMDTLLASLSVHSPFMHACKIKHALLQLDMEDKAIQEKGLAQLQTLVDDKANHFRDVAQYYLGLYYWVLNDLERAKPVWQALTQSQEGLEREKMSVWAELAKEKIEQIA